MIYTVILGLALAGVSIWGIRQQTKLRWSGKQGVVKQGAFNVVQTRLENERIAHGQTYRKLGDSQDQVETLTRSNADHARRTHEAAKTIKGLTDQRDELLARIMFDDSELETFFDDVEEAEAFLAKRKRAMESIRRIMNRESKHLDLSDAEWTDDQRHFEGEEEVFPHCSEADTIKARDALMSGFDNDDASTCCKTKNKENTP